MPNVVIVQGGPHIRTDNDGLRQYLSANVNVDYYCMFEGEVPFGNILERILSGSLDRKTPVAGAAFLDGDRLVYEPIIQKKGAITNIPSPYLTGELDEFLSASLMAPLLETNRGCPFSCTFCVWGISALDKLRTFSQQRVLDEIVYIASHTDIAKWIVTDANFGILPRDVEFANALRNAADTSKLRYLLVWWAKNSSKRTLEIAAILGDLSEPLAAVQSLDPKVLEAVKRDNMKFDTTELMIEHFHAKGDPVWTDVLVGMPEETLESHLQTLRGCFNFGFDRIDVGNIRLLPGSEMESEEMRTKYSLKTKYRMISGSYGIYGGEPVLEYEESVRETSTIKESEMISLRLVHFFVWAFWNLGISKPFLKWLHAVDGMNPLDIILAIIDEKEHSEQAKAFIREFQEEAKSEWFETPEALKEHYDAEFDDLLKSGFNKLNFKYMAKCLSSKEFTRTLLACIVAKANDKIVAREMADYCISILYFPYDADEQRISEIVISEPLSNALKIAGSVNLSAGRYQLEVPQQSVDLINSEFARFSGATRERVLALTLESASTRFVRQVVQ